MRKTIIAGLLLLLPFGLGGGRAEAQGIREQIRAASLELREQVEAVVRAEEEADSLRPDSVEEQVHAWGEVKLLRQRNLGRWKVPGGDYSGIVWLGGSSYAVVSDKEKKDGYIPFLIALDSVSGQVLEARALSLMGNPRPVLGTDGNTVRDCEGIAYFPPANTFFISGEGDQRILEYDPYGKPTGRELAVPEAFGADKIFPNYGFEALTYSADTGLFWTTTEQSLCADGYKVSYVFPDRPCYLRLQSFGDDLQPREQYVYLTDHCTARERGANYAFGVSALTALSDGTLLVLEREFYVAEGYLGSFVQQKIYRVDPSKGQPVTFADKLSELPPSAVLQKELVAEFRTQLNLSHLNLANYEGMCLGPRLADGRQTLILISDSQHNYGNALFRLKDYLKVIVLPV